MINEIEIKNLFADYFSFYAPPLPKGITLLSCLIDPSLKEGQTEAAFALLKGEIAPTLDDTFDTTAKAEIFRTILFEELGFKIQNLTTPKQISLKDVIRTRQTTPMFMATLYVLLAESFGLKAYVLDAQKTPTVCFRGELNSPAIYIDINLGGTFVNEDECHTYASSCGLIWQRSSLKALPTKTLIKHLLSNLVYVYSKNQETAKLNLTRDILQTCK